ncbi:hypothetical protein XENTR_v10002012, partial [Xenopus tropicalis]
VSVGPSAHLSFVAWLFCPRSNGQTVQQPVSQPSVLQGMEVQLNCTYSGADYLFWYVQNPDKPLEMLVSNYGFKTNKGFTSKEESSMSTFNLHKETAELSDSGVYFCAVRDTVTQTELVHVT